MIIDKKGKFVRWEDTQLEHRLIEVQKAFSRQGKSIWGSDSCDRCGACCYRFKIPEISEEYENCKYLELGDKAGCSLHCSEKPYGCKDWGCWDKRYAMGTALDRIKLMYISVNILRTKSLQDIVSVSI